MDRESRIDQITQEALDLLGTATQVMPFSGRYADFDLAEAYDVAARVRDLRRNRGETAIGRKIGFTNRAVWSSYDISGPIWNYMFDSTVRASTSADEVFFLTGLSEPRIEPEIVLHLAIAPHAGMSEEELIGCIDWVAHGFEIVHSIFPNWSFTAADAVAAYGVHGALLIGEQRSTSPDLKPWEDALSAFTVEMVCSDGVSRSGHAKNVLGGPIKALQFLVEELARYPKTEPLRAGEIVTTGTLTEAMPAISGERWATSFCGLELPGLALRFM
jgi:2-oxo-3-hexenedioate decarboxylase